MEHMSDGVPPPWITAHMPARVRMSYYDVSLRNAFGRVSSIARGGCILGYALGRHRSWMEGKSSESKIA